MQRKKALITGAASGIGKATALRFAQEGYDLCLNDLQEKKLQKVLKELPSGDHIIFAGSYADQSSMQSVEAMLQKSWGSLDVLVSCAGIFEKTDPVAMDISLWRKVFDIMVNGAYLVSQLAAKLMPNSGRIIHVTSIHGVRAEQYASAYAMAKSSVNQYCRALALELGEKNILVNAIAPGFVNTPMSVVDGVNELDSDWFKDNYVKGKRLPLRRAAEPEEIAGVAFFLAGKDASYITGQVITVDGGLTITF